jgi:hypothetical protein
MLCDFIEYPDELKELFSIISRGRLDKLDYLEANHLLGLNNGGEYVGSGGYGFSDQLPERDMNEHVCKKTGTGSEPPRADSARTTSREVPVPVFSQHVHPCDMWGFTESQETVHVSPKMYAEFIFPNEKPIMDRFGLTCYGCCEPLHGRWPTVKGHHNLRRVSCSAWVNVEKMADFLGDKYIFSYKPNPAALAVPEVNEESLRKGLREVLEKTRGCRVEIIMKDNHSLANRPENAVTWCRIAKEEVERIV